VVAKFIPADTGALRLSAYRMQTGRDCTGNVGQATEGRTGGGGGGGGARNGARSEKRGLM
jgi:hypothetical protein